MLSVPIMIVPPIEDVVDLAAMRLFLRIDGTALDEEIGALVAAVVSDIERMTSTRLAEQVVELQADRFSDIGRLSIGPVQEVVEIRYQDAVGTDATIAADTYELAGAGLEKGIRCAFGHVWPSPRPVAGAIAVQLRVGYGADLPAAIAMAVKMEVRSRFDGTPFNLFDAIVNDRIWL